MQNILTEGTAALLISYFTISGNILALKAGGNKLHLRPQISWGMCSSTFLAAAWLICHEKYVIAVWYNTWEKTPRLDKFVYKSNLVSYNEMCLVQMNLEAIFFFFKDRCTRVVFITSLHIQYQDVLSQVLSSLSFCLFHWISLFAC